MESRPATHDFYFQVKLISRKALLAYILHKKHKTLATGRKPTSRPKGKKVIQFEQAKRTRLMKRNGLVEPASVALESPAFKALQQEWYAKLEASEASKPEDKRFVDIEWQPNPDSPHLKQAASKGRLFVPGKELYYQLAQNFLTHNRNWKHMESAAWKMHVEGVPYRTILKRLKSKFGCKRSIFWMYYFIEKTRTRMFKWNKKSKYGLYYGQEASNTTDWETRLDHGFWEGVPSKR